MRSKCLIEVLLSTILLISPTLQLHPALAVPKTSCDAKEETSNKDIGKRILAKWNCLRPGNTSVEVEFKITDEGHAYGIHFTKGLEDPYAVKAAIHAIIFAMPYEKTILPAESSLIKCTINGDRSMPSIEATVNEVASSSSSADDLSKVTALKNYHHQLFIHGPMARRLKELCLHLYSHPDSQVAVNEVKKLSKYVGLDTRRDHDWIGISRCGNQSIVIMRHPSSHATRLIRSSIGALQQAFRLSSNDINRYALEEAWVKHAAIEALAISKAEPLLLASAAVLTNQFKMATEQYRLAIRERTPKAAAFLSLMTMVDTESKVEPLKLKEAFRPIAKSNYWEPLLNWIPVDTELIISSRIKATESADGEKNHFFGNRTLPNSPNASEIPRSRDQLKLLQNNKLFLDVPEICCLHAARNFNTPKGGFIGIGFSENVDIIVFPDSHKQVAAKAMSVFRKKCDLRDLILGFEVLAFEEFPWSFGVSQFGSKKFLVSPYEGVLIAATDPEILRENLYRLRNQPTNRALPDSIPEWKYADKTAPCWALRHYDQAYVPFDYSGMFDIKPVYYSDSSTKNIREQSLPIEIGLTYSIRNSFMKTHRLSNNPKTLNHLKKSYEHAFNYNPNMIPGYVVEKPGNFKAKIEGNVLTVEGRVGMYSVVPIQTLISLGYFVAI